MAVSVEFSPRGAVGVNDCLAVVTAAFVGRLVFRTSALLSGFFVGAHSLLIMIYAVRFTPVCNEEPPRVDAGRLQKRRRGKIRWPDESNVRAICQKPAQ